MLIALVGTDLCSVASGVGGLELVVRQWGEALAGQYEVVLVDPCPDSLRDPVTTKLQSVRVPSPDGLRSVLDRLRPDVVQVNNRPLWDFGDHRLVYTFHNFPPSPDRARDLAWGVELPQEMALLHSAFRHHRIAAISETLGRHIEEVFSFHRGSVSTVYPVVDPIFLKHRHIGGSGILFPNRLMRKKGVEVVLEAIEHPELRSRPVRFLDYTSPFLRNSEEYQTLRTQVINSRAELVAAHWTREELAREYARADVVITVALEPEGLGLVPLEAQAVGTPVVTAGPGGLQEATLHPNLHVPAEAGDIAQALMAALASTPSPEPRDVVTTRFSAGAVLVSLEAALR